MGINSDWIVWSITCENNMCSNLHIIMSCISRELESLHILLVLIVVQEKEYEDIIALPRQHH
jgi:hypothetical protein